MNEQTEPKRGDFTVTPDGYSCRVELTAGKFIQVFLTNVHWENYGDRYRSYPKTHWVTP